jgi:hypothetical protein
VVGSGFQGGILNGTSWFGRPLEGNTPEHLPICLGNNLHAQESRNLHSFLGGPLPSAAVEHIG